MHQIALSRLCALRTARLVALASVTLAATPVFAASSSALSLSADFVVDGTTTTHLGPINEASGHTPPVTYSHTVTLASFSQFLKLLPTASLSPALSVQSSQLDSTARGLMGVDSSSADGVANLGNTQVALTLFPLPPVVGIVPVPYLDVQAQSVSAQAEFSQVIPLAPRFSGNADISALSITGQLLGGHSVHLSGSIAPNTVLYQDAHLKIIGNRRLLKFPICPLTTGILPPCHPDASTTDALYVEFIDAPVGGHTVSGTLVVGAATAGQ